MQSTKPPGADAYPDGSAFKQKSSLGEKLREKQDIVSILAQRSGQSVAREKLATPPPQAPVGSLGEDVRIQEQPLSVTANQGDLEIVMPRSATTAKSLARVSVPTPGTDKKRSGGYNTIDSVSSIVSSDPSRTDCYDSLPIPVTSELMAEFSEEGLQTPTAMAMKSTADMSANSTADSGTASSGRFHMPKPPSVPKVKGPRPLSIAFICGASAEILGENQIDRSELTWGDVIGRGRTAHVYEGRWRDKKVAIKRLDITKKRAAQLKLEVAFLRETAIIAQISHRSLVKFHGLAFDQQPYVLISEFCNGGALYDLLHESEYEELTAAQQLKMCTDVAEAMDYLHKFKPQIVHRDLKSLNLLLHEPVTSTADIPLVKVADFGIGKMRDDEEEWGVMTKEVGTPHWMAPEMGTQSYDEKVDIYSYSMVIFEIICREIPFDDLDPGEVLQVANGGTRPDLEAVPPRMPGELIDLMVSCWEQEPDDRPSFEVICKSLTKLGGLHPFNAVHEDDSYGYPQRQYSCEIK